MKRKIEEVIEEQSGHAGDTISEKNYPSSPSITCKNIKNLLVMNFITKQPTPQETRDKIEKKIKPRIEGKINFQIIEQIKQETETQKRQQIQQEFRQDAEEEINEEIAWQIEQEDERQIKKFKNLILSCNKEWGRVDINFCNKEGNSLLHVAFNKFVETRSELSQLIIRELIYCGADENAKNNRGITVAELLLEYGLNFDDDYESSSEDAVLIEGEGEKLMGELGEEQDLEKNFQL